MQKIIIFSYRNNYLYYFTYLHDSIIKKSLGVVIFERNACVQKFYNTVESVHCNWLFFSLINEIKNIIYYPWFQGPPGLTGPKGEPGEPGLPAPISTANQGINVKGDKGKEGNMVLVFQFIRL